MVQRRIYLGADVSFGLNFDPNVIPTADTELPLLAEFSDIATWLGVTESTLQWLTFDGEKSRTDHYIRFSLKKRVGGRRDISSPKPQLRAAQEKICKEILSTGRPNRAAMAYVKGRNIAQNAMQHVGRDVVIRIDIADFFPSINFRQVKRVFASFGYNEGVQTVLALLCTDRHRRQMLADGVEIFVRSGPRFLPQGSPTSPVLSNLVFRYLDGKLANIADCHSMVYSRYADDLFFSGESGQESELIRAVRLQLRKGGFRVNRYKTHVWHKHLRQRVTGLTVNVRPNIGREEWRKFRVFLHYVELNGLEHYAANYVRGFTAFVQMVDPFKAMKLRRDHPAFFSVRARRTTYTDEAFDKHQLYATPTRGLFVSDDTGGTVWLWGPAEKHRIPDIGNRLITDGRLRKVALAKYLEVREKLASIERDQQFKRAISEKMSAGLREISQLDDQIKSFANFCGISTSDYERLHAEDSFLRNEVINFRRRERQRIYSECRSTAMLKDDPEEQRLPNEGHLIIGIHFLERSDENDTEQQGADPKRAKTPLSITKVGRQLLHLGEFISLQSIGDESTAPTPGLHGEIAQIIEAMGVREDAFLHLLKFDLWMLSCAVAIANPEWYRRGNLLEFWDIAKKTTTIFATSEEWEMVRAQIDFDPASVAPEHSRSVHWVKSRCKERLALFSALAHSNQS